MKVTKKKKAEPGKHPNSLKNLKSIKPGQVLNPKGRPKGSLQIPPLLNRLLNEVSTKQYNGKARKLTHLEHIGRKMIELAEDGDKGAAEVLFGRLEGGILQNMKINADDPLLTILERAAAARGK